MATIGVDVGTSACKAVVLSRNGQIRHTAWATYRTQRGLDGAVSQRAEDWLRALVATTRECAGSTSEAVEAISVTAPAHNVVIVGDDGQPLRPVMLWSDSRPSLIARDMRQQLGSSFFDRTFVSLTEGWSLPQLLWIREHDPSVYSKARLILPGKDFLRYSLTGYVATDHSDAAGTALYDARLRSWDGDLLQLAGLSVDQVPPIRGSFELAGALQPAMARKLGLRSGTPAVVGATDTAAELCAAGVAKPGDGLIKIASTGTVVAVSDAPKPSPRLMTYPHAIDGLWYSIGATSAAATSYSWLREIVYAEATRRPEQVYQEMSRRASRIDAGSNGLMFLPFLQGERTPYWDSQLRAAFLGLSATHGRDHMCRAVLEGVAMSLRMCRDEVQSVGHDLDRMRLAGGGAASRLWREIVTSVLNVNARSASTSGPAVGAAEIASRAIYGDRAAPLRMRFPLVRPRSEWIDLYGQLFDVYRDAADIVAPISHRLSSLAAVR